MRIKINCENLNRRRRIDLSRMRKIAAEALKLSGGGDVELNLVFVSNQKIRAMNRKYLKRDRATDVISFDQEAVLGKDRKSGHLVLGDVFISTDKAAQNAAEYGTTFEEETVLYVVHGILHVRGYRDGTREEKETMRRKEYGILSKIRKTF